ncbi:MAG: hypothetical protein M3Y31_01680 [Gemmatimonadota bacterium]|nr:hypothetical protein [Gemmatimonadota bacterium]
MRRQTAAAASSSGTREFAPIRIFTAELELDGFVATAGQRITDILLRGHDLAFLPAGAEPDPSNWVAIEPSEILIASPPPLAGRWNLHSQRERWPVELRVGRYGIRGTAHVGFGETRIDEIAARQTFLPLTDAELTREGVDGSERYAVLIVNLAKRRR